MKTIYQLLFSILLLLPLINSAQGQDNPDENGVYSIVDEMPEYPGGEEALKKFITENVNYPEDAKKNGIVGKVFVSFIVNETGNVELVKLVKAVDSSLDKEAIRVVSSMPDWKPGKEKGKAVKVSYTLPINFSMS